MTSPATMDTGPAQWQAMLPPGRRFVALPSRRQPLVIAEDDPSVLRYVRTALLAPPPRSSLPAWVFTAARETLRIPVSWRLVPHVQSPGGPGALGELMAGHRLLILRHSHDPDARLMLLLFRPGARWPSRAVKVPSEQGGAARVLREADRLRGIAALPVGSLRESIPEVLTVAPGPALVTTAVPGTPMLVGYHRHGHTSRPATVRADLTAAGAWLARFQAATAGDPAPLDVAPGVGEALRQRPATRKAVQDRLSALRDRLRRHQAPRTAVHGDFWPGNLLTDRGAITGVVDWEWAGPAGNPVRDLARFALSYSDYLDRHTRPGRPVRGHHGLLARPGAAVAYALDGDGWYPRLIRDFLHTGLSRLGVSPACARDAVLAEIAAVAAEASDHTFAEHHLRVFERLTGEVPA
ncbi:phosphotransferase family protein [Amycolatopsis pithecellobii]|uniref:Phosphotransferase n=1 Tax=Amycolatopsis pithecellobii TaxID=664692 RepID=A0A6N7Z175_9PSEU|nr:aminoglycoside phosphotransferase family protein [Amycolatopsis pithecellobii]MTD55133.1 phosphotransferase [Amycolatopsis pithecellobii]